MVTADRKMTTADRSFLLSELLTGSDPEPVAAERFTHALPAGAVGESSVHENDIALVPMVILLSLVEWATARTVGCRAWKPHKSRD
jgi:hypothetical protein